jgi:hypothetical protein
MGTYVSGNNLVVPVDNGLLRITTSPAVPTTIYLDGIPRDDWALDWVRIAPGSYALSFSDVYGYAAPASVTVNYYPGPKGIVQSISSPVNIYPDTVTEIVAGFLQMGSLRVETIQRDVAATIYCNGVPVNDWEFWPDVLPGQYTIPFESFSGNLTPPPITVTVVAGSVTHVVGNYLDGTSGLVP